VSISSWVVSCFSGRHLHKLQAPKIDHVKKGVNVFGVIQQHVAGITRLTLEPHLPVQLTSYAIAWLLPPSSISFYNVKGREGTRCRSGKPRDRAESRDLGSKVTLSQVHYRLRPCSIVQSLRDCGGIWMIKGSLALEPLLSANCVALPSASP
jgi:hypothetical protein